MEDYQSKYTGQQVESLLDKVANGEAGGGGGGIAVETDPVFSASPAADITKEQIRTWDDTHELVGSIDEDISKLYDALDGKQDTLVSGENIKTINGESIVGEGDITIAGGSGEKGDKGDKGDTGVGVASVAQTTTSNADGGSNIVTVTLTDGTKSTFTVKNGSKGSQGIQGIQGEQGPKGDKGDKGDTGANGTNGTNGVSVSSVKQTTTSTADGGTNVVTVTLSNGTTSTFTVKNGSKGSSGSNGTNGKDGADGATFTPSVDSAGNLSWTNNKGLTNPPTVNIKGPKGDAGEGGGSGGGKEVVYTALFFSDGDPMQPNKIYINNSAALMTIGILALEQISDYDVYTAIFRWPEEGLYLPNGTLYANGQSFNIEYGTLCELSIVGTNILGERVYSAVLTPFKPA